MCKRVLQKAMAVVKALLVFGVLHCNVLAKEKAVKNEGKGPGPETSLELLNRFSKKTEPVNRLYSAIFNSLKSSPTASFETVSKDKEVQKLCSELNMNYLGGPMLGNLQKDGASVWVRTLNPAKVTVNVKINGETKVFGPVESTYQSDLTAAVVVSGLAPGSTTPYEVLVDGKVIPASKYAAIRTSPEGSSDQTRIVFGTCPHRWGLGNEKQAEQIVKRAPNAFLIYGDIAVQDREDNFGMQRADYALRDFHPAWQNIVSGIPVYASWDDHDYAKNDGWGLKGLENEEGRKGTRKIFAQSWCNLYYGLGDDGGGIFQHTRIGPCDIIMTDNRYFREQEGEYRFLGKEQMAWLKKTLLECKGSFIIMSSGTMWSDYVSDGKDSWGVFDPKGREEIFKLIEDNKIGGVLLISGDRHGARGFTIPRPSGFSFYEFEPASLGGRSGPTTIVQGCKSQLFGISGQYAFGEFTFDTSKKDPEVTFRLIGDDGKVIYELTLKRSQLTPKS